VSGKPRGPVDWARHYAALRESGQHPLLTAAEARAEVDRLSTELYYAQDAHAFVGEMCDIVDAKQNAPAGYGTLLTADVREWLKGARCVRLMAVHASLVLETRPEEDADLLTEALRVQVRAALESSGRSQASIARELQVSTKHLNQMLMGRQRITLWWAARILRACGMRLVVGEGQQ
jgi:DNA-binding phage protein